MVSVGLFSFFIVFLAEVPLCPVDFRDIRVEIITTPRDVSIGCGLSVRFELDDLSRVQAIYRQLQPSNLIGFYRVERRGGGRPSVVPLG